MIYEGMAATPTRDEQRNDQKVTDLKTQTSISRRTKLIGPGEFYQRSIETQILKINQAMEEAMSQGKIEIELPMDIYSYLKEELKSAGWALKTDYKCSSIYLYAHNFKEYEKGLKKDSKADDFLFITAEDYYRQVRKAQITLINKSIEETIEAGRKRSVHISFTPLPIISEMLQVLGWNYNSTSGTLSLLLTKEAECEIKFKQKAKKELRF